MRSNTVSGRTRRPILPEDPDGLAARLRELLVGQPEAIDTIVPYVQMYQAGLAPEGRPVGVVLLLGPTGTGKTRTVEALAEALHGSSKNLLKVDCGEFQMEHEVAKLIGAPPGYLGHRETQPMLTQARQLAPTDAPLEFLLADATVHAFEPSSIDLLVSRFGVMFFADPALSFTNLRKAMRSSGRLAFACWREPRENPWMIAPLQAAYKHVPKLPQLGPEDPGPYAFASEARVHRILGEAGFVDLAMERCDLSLDLAVGRGLDAAVKSALEIGPAPRALEGQPADVVAAAATSIREVLAPFASGQAVALPASIWIVTARNP